MVVRRMAPAENTTRTTATTATPSNVRRLRARPTNTNSSAVNTPVSAAEDPDIETETERRGRGRRRTLPLMTNSERARYYRRKNAEETDALEAATVQLRREVSDLEIRLRVHRQLEAAALPPAALQRVFEFVQHFVETQLHTMTHGLQRPQHEIVSIELRGEGTAPIVRVDALVRGRLATPAIHRIYPFVLGNTVVLDELMHQQLTFACAYLFFFSAGGVLQREIVQIDSILGLRGPLGSLATVARVVSDVDVHAEPDAASPAPRSRRRTRKASSTSTH